MRNMAIGGIVAVVGLGITLVTASAASGGGRYVIAWGAILAGAIQFVIGLMAHQKHLALPPADQVLPSVTEGPRALIAALAGSVRHAEAPSAAEIAAVHKVLRETIKTTVHDPVLTDVARAMGRDPDGVDGYLAKKSADLDPALKPVIVQGCCAVMMADPSREDALPKLVAIGKALNMTESQVLGMVEAMARRLDGKSLTVKLNLTPEEARDGTRITFSYKTLIACPACAGKGCEACANSGRVSGDREITIDVPAGVQDGGQLKSTGQGERALAGGTPGDLFIQLAVAPRSA